MSTLVVARWREDVSWTERVSDWTVRIVQKDVDLPNRGREPSSFLWAILNGPLDDRMAFVQGNPFDHCPALLEELSQPVEGYRPLGSWFPTSDGNGAPNHHGLSVAPTFSAWLGAEFPGTITFAAGGQFMVSAERIRSRPMDFYRRILDDLMADETGQLPYVAERLWPAIFA